VAFTSQVQSQSLSLPRSTIYTGQAAFVGVIDRFEVMMIAMLIVSPLVPLLRKSGSVP